MMSTHLDRYCYVRSKRFGWVPATLIDQDDESATVSFVDYDSEQDVGLSSKKKVGSHNIITETVPLRDYPNDSLLLQNVDEMGNLIVVSNMIDLKFLHEASIFFNLKARHLQSIPYTRTGAIIIAVNPYKWIPRLYSPERRHLYSQELIWNPGQIQEEEEGSFLEPHVYEISALAYKGLALQGKNQAILVSGESGAGKTETVKICMDHLASIQSGPESRGMALAGDSTHVVQKILDSNPLLEAFGNAKTRRNDNSSRFGKYTQLQFHRPTNTNNSDPSSMAVNVPECHMVGSRCEVYLLEKSRVVSHEPQERTFHIFYQLLAAPDNAKARIWKKLAGTECRSFSYVGKTGIDMIEGITDEDRFVKTLHALNNVGIEGKSLKLLMRAICAVLQMGNVTFCEGEISESSKITYRTELNALSDITGIPSADLEYSLTHRRVTVRGETTSVPLRYDVAKEFLDALAKHVYSLLFSWLVNTINTATCATKRESNSSLAGASSQDFGVIGLLDIFGFEYFEMNGFEQLCINFANEMLQSKFTRDVFQSVFEEYANEGLSLDQIHYDDNTNVLDLIQTPRIGVMSVLNEECILPKGNDEAFCRKVIANAKASKSQVLFIKAGFDSYNFGIHHYAASVVYDSYGFLTKNQDTLPSDLVECVISKSTNPILCSELSKDESMTEKSNIPSRSKQRKSNIVAATVWTKYRSQLAKLMKNLEKSQNQYIRCIKPNDEKVAMLMQHDITLNQLRSAGVISAVEMSRAAFPNRLEHKLVLERFEPMWRLYWCRRLGFSLPRKSTRHSQEARYCDDVERLLSAALDPLKLSVTGRTRAAYAVGKTRTYFAKGSYEYLESLRFKALELAATTIQKHARGMMTPKILRPIVRIQSWWRMCLACRLLIFLRKEAKSRKKKARRASRLRNADISRKHTYLDNECSRLEREALRLQTILEDSVRDHHRKMDELHQLKERELAGSKKDLTLLNQKSRSSVLDDVTIQKLRKTNKFLRKQLEHLEDEKQVVGQNTITIAESNEEASEALLDEKDVNLQLTVTNHRLENEYTQLLKMIELNQHKKEARLSQLNFEKQSIAIYQRSTKKILKLINKGIPGTWLANEIEKISQVGLIGDFEDSSVTSGTSSSSSYHDSSSFASDSTFDDGNDQEYWSSGENGAEDGSDFDGDTSWYEA